MPFRNGQDRTKYRAEYADLARKFCLLGARDPELAKLFEVSETTIKVWQEKHDDFAIAILEGREAADANVVNALYTRAVGFTKQRRTVKRGRHGIETTTTVDYFPPDVAAAQFWLKNRRAADWKDKIEHTHKDKTDPLDLSQLDADERQALRDILEKERATIQ